MNKGIVH